MKKLIQNLLPALLLIVLAGCNLLMQPDPTLEIPPAKKGLVRVGYALRPPFVIKDKEKQLSGLEIDLLKLLAQQQGYELEFLEYPLNELVFAVRRGEVDLMTAGFTEREIAELFLSPAGAYMQTGQRVIVNADIAPYITDKSQLDNNKIRVYTVAGSPAAEQVEIIFPNTETISLKNSANCIKKVIGGRGNIFVLNARDAAPIIADSDSGLALVLGLLSQEKLAWGVRRKEKKWREELDRFIDAMRQSGKLQELIDKHRADAINK